jgi:tRNA threonylcarbamoyladenosine biosynthesis protein TsaE
MNRTIICETVEDTQELAKKLAKELLREKNRERAVVVGLVGELGSGKTTFTQSLLAELGIKKRILSPTFVIWKRFRLPKKTSLKDAYHLDAYRIQAKDLIDLGWEKILNGCNLIVIEWAGRIKKVLPPDTIWINFAYGRTKNERKITLNRR